MTLQYNVTIPNIDQIRDAFKDPELIRVPLREFLHKAGFTIEAEAKKRSPVDTGRLRASIGSVVDVPGARAIIGTPVEYAAFVEFGTRPHWPPVAALQPWARRHGFPNAFLVARAIARRGTRAHPFMGPALAHSKARITALVGEMAMAIEKLFHRKTR